MSQTKAQLIDNLVQPITGALGSASAPTFSFTTDPNTGIYSPGADQLALSTGGTGRLFVDASGRILVGNSATTSVAGFNGFLQLQGTNFDTATVALTNVAANNTGSYLLLGKARGGTLGGYTSVNNGDNLGQIRFMGADGTGYVEAAYIGVTCNGVPGTNNMPGRLFFSTNSGTSSVTERMCITPSGLVGVGTSSPSTNFHIVGTSDTIARVTAANAASSVLDLGTVAAPTAGRIIYDPGNNLCLYSNSAERLRIDSSGRVGIGTSTVDQLLHLKAANPVLEVEGTAASSGDTGIHFKANANEWFVRADNSTGTNTFSIKSGSPASSTHRFLIDSSGRVGIGTANPGAALDVVGGNAGDLNNPAVFIQNSKFLTLRQTSGNWGMGLYVDGSNNSYTVGLNNLIFGTGSSATERARIPNGGGLCVGSTVSPNALTQASGIRIGSSTIANYDFTNITTSPVTIANGVGIGGLAFVQAFNTSNGAQYTGLIMWRSGVVAVVSESNALGFALTYSVSGSTLRLQTASGTISGSVITLAG